MAVEGASRGGGDAAARPLRVLVVSDGVPGHDRSSYGIVSALRKHRSVEARLLPVRELRGGSRRVKRVLARMLPFERFWKGFYAVGERSNPAQTIPLIWSVPEDAADLVISTGPATAGANIALARRFGARNVYFGFPQWPVTGAFTALLTPGAAGAAQNVAHVLRPSELDASALPEPRPLVSDPSGRRAALLFGGDTKHYRYTTADLELLADRVGALAREAPWLEWTVFDSRRTPREPFEHFVRNLGALRAPVSIVRFQNAGMLSNLSAFESDLVLVTADSMSMISEAIAAGRPTGILCADAYVPPKRDALEHAALIAERRAFRVTFSELAASALLDAVPALRLVTISQLDLLYEALVQRAI